jgi:RNA polymerase sigma-32 factor
MEMESRLSGHDITFDTTPATEDEDSHSVAPASYLAAESTSDPAVVLERSNWEQQGEKQLQRALVKLDDRSRHIMQRRWLDENKATLQELADHYGVSAERIRQLENNAIKKLGVLMA